jgi:hypothetical protein
MPKLSWSDLTLPPINLWNAPNHENNETMHEHFLPKQEDLSIISERISKRNQALHFQYSQRRKM